MKKTILFGLALTLLVGGCTRNKPGEKTILGMGTDYFLFPETLKGKVKELKEYNYWAIEKDGKITKGDLINWKMLDSIGSTKNLVAYFDNAGLLIRYDLLDENNVERYSSIAKTENGKWIRFENKMRDSITSYGIPKYDDQGYFIEGNDYNPVKDTLLYKYVFTHDKNGHYTKAEFFNSRNKRTNFMDLSVDAEGKVIEIKFFNRNDSLRSTMKNEYNDNGYIIRQITYNERTKNTSTWNYKDLTSDDHGNWLQSYANIDNGKYKILIERSYTYY